MKRKKPVIANSEIDKNTFPNPQMRQWGMQVMSYGLKNKAEPTGYSYGIFLLIIKMKVVSGIADALYYNDKNINVRDNRSPAQEAIYPRISGNNQRIRPSR